MASIRETRKKLMPIVIALVIIDLACVGYLFSPAGRSRQARQREYTKLREQLIAKQQEVLPTRGMDQKLKQASQDITGFYDTRFATEYSSVAEELGKIAADTGVHLSGVKYDEKDAPIEGLRKLNMELSISGDYLQEVKFINALERDKMFFLVDGITLSEQQGNVRLQLKLETYMRGSAGIVKLGTENKKKTILALVLVVLAVGLLVYQFSGNGGENAPSQTAAHAGAAKSAHKAHALMAHSLDPTLRFDLLKSSEDMTYKGNGRNIFSSQAPPPEIPKQEESALLQQQAPPPPPPPPPSGLKFYGFAGPKNGAKQIFLLKGEDIFLAKEGDVVDRRYKIVRVGTTSVEVQDVLTNHTETLPLSAG